MVLSKVVKGESLNLSGRNGSGKSVACDRVVEEARGNNVKYLSRDREEMFVKKYGNSKVSHVLGGIRNAQDLIVRFGLVNIWHRNISKLSTGETRKLYLAYSISNTSDLIVLDQPYDGLDVHTRQVLRYMIEEISEGLSQMLVGTHTIRSCNGGSGENTHQQFESNKPTQVVLVTNRLKDERIRDTQVVSLDNDDLDIIFPCKKKLKSVFLDTLKYSSSTSSSDAINVDGLTLYSDKEDTDEMVEEENISQFKILNNVSWRVCRGESWIVYGSNGSGKSSLMRSILLNQDNKSSIQRFASIVYIGPHSIMSTLPDSEFHPNDLVRDLLFDSDHPLCSLLNFDKKMMDRQMSSLSQGEFQMVLFGKAFLLSPDVFVIDEGFQGLDKWNRSLILEILDYMSHNRLLTTIIISHHEDEWLPSSTNRLDLHEGSVVGNYKI
jgi:molybdate transport system ATP-binding protein